MQRSNNESQTHPDVNCGCHPSEASSIGNDINAHVRSLSDLQAPHGTQTCDTEGMHVHDLPDFLKPTEFCFSLFPGRSDPKRLDWTPNTPDLYDDCGTPDSLPPEYLSAAQLTNATHRPPSYTKEPKTHCPPEDPNDIIRRLSTKTDNCLGEQCNEPTYQSKSPGPLADHHIPNPPGEWSIPGKGLRFTPTVTPSPVTPTVVGMAPNNILAECFDYLYTAWFTVVAALDSPRRIRRQWWYYRNDTTDTPAYWLGRYGPAKLQKLANALTMACARMTGGIYYNQQQPDLNYIVDMSMGNCSPGISDCAIVGDELRVCSNFGLQAENDQKIWLMAALLVNDVTTNRGTLTVAHKHYGDDDTGAELIKNAYNISHWVKHRFDEHGWKTRSPGIPWDIRPDKSYLPVFKARLPRVYHVWPKKDSDHTQLRRAWDHSWCYAESALRFLYKLTYMTDKQIEHMWNFGTDADPTSTPRFFLGERQREVIEDPNRNIAPVSFTPGAVVPSMRNFFGTWSKKRFLAVYRVVLCLCLRYENNYDRGSTHLTQKFRLYPGNGKSYGALAFPTGEVDLHKKWFDLDDEYRARTINHELMHYLIRWDGGGRPRDWKSPSLCTVEGDKCYALEECLALAAANDGRCLSNNNNYVFWFLHRWLRWGGDWPPEYDAGPGETWHNDPIEDTLWENHTYDSVIEIGWERLDSVEHKFELEGYMPRYESDD